MMRVLRQHHQQQQLLLLQKRQLHVFLFRGLMGVGGIYLMVAAIYNYASLLRTLPSTDNDNRIGDDSAGVVPEKSHQYQQLQQNGGGDHRDDSTISNIRRRNWTRSVQNATGTLLGTHIFRPHTSIDRIHLIGERHSGTTYFTGLLQECFPNLQVSDVFVNGKHWMQPSPEEVRRVVTSMRSMDMARELDLLSWWNLRQHDKMEHAFQSSMVVSLFRDPYQWVEAMRQKPHHWPNHVAFRPTGGNLSAIDIIPKAVYNAPKEPQHDRRNYDSKKPANSLRLTPESTTFGGKITGGSGSIQKSFVDYELLNWTSFVEQQLSLEGGYLEDRTTVCQKGLPFISPCRRNRTYVPEGIRHIPRSFLRHLFASANDPVYELTPQGDPYSTMLHVRAAKIQNFLQISSEWDVAAIAIFPYEQLLSDISSVLDQISKAVTQPLSCAIPEVTHKAPYGLPNDFRTWIDEHASWDVERLLGYSRSFDGHKTQAP